VNLELQSCLASLSESALVSSFEIDASLIALPTLSSVLVVFREQTLVIVL